MSYRQLVCWAKLAELGGKTRLCSEFQSQEGILRVTTLGWFRVTIGGRVLLEDSNRAAA